MSKQNAVVLALISGVIACAILTTAATSFAATIDTGVGTGSFINYVFYAADDNGQNMQSVTATDDACIESATFKMGNFTGASAVDMHVELRAVDGSGFPTGAAIATSDTINTSVLPTGGSFDDTDFVFTGAPAWTNGTQYALNLVSDTYTASGDIRVYGGSGYTGGKLGYTSTDINTWNNVGSPSDAQLVVVTGECGSPPTPTPATPTTTVMVVQDAAEQMYNAMILFFVSAAFIIWLMRK